MESKRIQDYTDTFVFRSERPWPNPRMRRGAIVGHTTPDSARIWVRTGAKGFFKLVVIPHRDEADGTFEKIIESPLVSDADLKNLNVRQEDFSVPNFDDDTTKIIDVDKLSPGAYYSYLVLQEAEEANQWQIILGRDKVLKRNGKGLRFRTLHKEEVVSEKGFSFALFSCHNPFVEDNNVFSADTIKTENMAAWHALAQTLDRHGRREDIPLEFVIAGGDQAYTDGRPSISIWNFLYKVARKDGDVLLPDFQTMLSWYRDIYRGYWGFPVVRHVFSHYPTYMMWDDHEIGDGWGSFDLLGSGKHNHPIYDELGDRKDLSTADLTELLNRMFRAAREAYVEYEHSHNPNSPDGSLHYQFKHGKCAFFFLDGRGHRNFSARSHRIHGKPQMEEFKAYVESLAPGDTKFLFVVSAVPLIHTTDKVVGLEDNFILGAVRKGDRDDLRDAWEHFRHDEERKEFKHILWEASMRGIRVCILSGDVHASAAFRLEREGYQGKKIYQLTSSAITYHLNWFEDKVAKFFLPAAETGNTDENETFTRLALSTRSPYSIIQVFPDKGKAVFQLYGVEEIPAMDSEGNKQMVTRSNSTQRIELWGNDENGK